MSPRLPKTARRLNHLAKVQKLNGITQHYYLGRHHPKVNQLSKHGERKKVEAAMMEAITEHRKRVMANERHEVDTLQRRRVQHHLNHKL